MSTRISQLHSLQLQGSCPAPIATLAASDMSHRATSCSSSNAQPKMRGTRARKKEEKTAVEFQDLRPQDDKGQAPRPSGKGQRSQDGVGSSSSGKHQTAPKGVISLLQEFVQCSKNFQSPQNQQVLKWSYDTRMEELTVLEFRAAVAFLFDGVPHHVAGSWQLSKKLAQRDAAERALAFYIGRWGEQLSAPPVDHIHVMHLAFGEVLAKESFEVNLLEAFCRHFPNCEGPSLKWTITSSASSVTACAEVCLLGVLHKFAGNAEATEQLAKADTAKKVLWYLGCPGFEDLFLPDVESPKELSAPPSNWASHAAEADGVIAAERKTLLMRVQNRLQQTFARQLKPGQGVWEWDFENDMDDPSWPPLCRASVHIAAIPRTFLGQWARGQREAQIEACLLVEQFLNQGGLTLSAKKGGGSLDVDVFDDEISPSMRVAAGGW